MSGEFKPLPPDHPQVMLARIDEWRKSSDARLDSINEKLDALVSKESFADLARRVKAIESTQSWLWRTFVLTAIAAVSSVFAWGKQHGAP